LRVKVGVEVDEHGTLEAKSFTLISLIFKKHTWYTSIGSHWQQKRRPAQNAPLTLRAHVVGVFDEGESRRREGWDDPRTICAVMTLL
jgi:hypothetical protein